MTSTLALDLLPARPLWSKRSNYLERAVPPPWRPWLWGKGSLTAQLRALPFDFSVQILHESHGVALRTEQAQLPAKTSATGWVRDVALRLDDHRAVLARTFVPDTSLSGSLSALKHLGEQPLGHYLFSQPSLRRGPLHVRRCEEGNRHHLCWSRTSVLMIAQKPLIITEGFTHDFEQQVLCVPRPTTLIP